MSKGLPFPRRPDAGAFDSIASFGEDAARNLYIVDIDGEIFMVSPRQ